jgi:hypothetical protein
MKHIKINSNELFTNEHYVFTKRGMVKAKDLKDGDVIIGHGGETKITSIQKYISKIRN